MRLDEKRLCIRMANCTYNLGQRTGNLTFTEHERELFASLAKEWDVMYVGAPRKPSKRKR